MSRVRHGNQTGVIRKAAKIGLLALFAVVVFFAVEEYIDTETRYPGSRSTGRIATLYTDADAGLEVHLWVSRRGLTLRWNRGRVQALYHSGSSLHILGLFRYRVTTFGGTGGPGGLVYKRTSSLHIPLIVLLGTLAAYPVSSWAFAVLRHRSRRRRRREGWCVKCGYDLTGNESGKCPECGTEIEPRRSG